MKQHTLFNGINSGVRTLVDMVFPRLCALCRIEGTLLCSDCVQSLSVWPTGVCAWCNTPDNRSNVCETCASVFGFDGLWVGYRYNDEKVARLIHLLKFGHRESIGSEMGTILSRTIPPLPSDIQAVVPIPLDTKRSKERGFNQALSIAKNVATIQGLTIDTNVLVRTTARVPQARLDAPSRWDNMHDVYRVTTTKPIPKSVLLVDDVTTTGATLLSATSTLRNAGVASVYVLVFAHGMPPENFSKEPFRDVKRAPKGSPV